MAKRDPNKTARNRMIESIKLKLRALLPDVLDETGLNNEQSVNATIGSKNDEFFDLKHDVIHSQEQFLSMWLAGLKESALEDGVSAHLSLWKKIKKHKKFREYVFFS